MAEGTHSRLTLEAAEREGLLLTALARVHVGHTDPYV